MYVMPSHAHSVPKPCHESSCCCCCCRKNLNFPLDAPSLALSALMSIPSPLDVAPLDPFAALGPSTRPPSKAPAWPFRGFCCCCLCLLVEVADGSTDKPLSLFHETPYTSAHHPTSIIPHHTAPVTPDAR